MGETHADLKVTRLFGNSSIRVRTLVDTGTSRLILTPHIARALGARLDELPVRYVNLADGRRLEAPHLEALTIEYPDRRCTIDAIILPGDQCLLGFIPLETMDLIVDPLNQRLMPRPARHGTPA